MDAFLYLWYWYGNVITCHHQHSVLLHASDVKKCLHQKAKIHLELNLAWSKSIFQYAFAVFTYRAELIFRYSED